MKDRIQAKRKSRVLLLEILEPDLKDTNVSNDRSAKVRTQKHNFR